MAGPQWTADPRAWLAEDPDPETRQELADLLKAAEDGDAEAAADLADRFSARLQFGTAGLRGELGAGPNRMNRITVIRAAAGLAAFLTERGGPGRTVVIGYDARTNSRRFAEDTAEVMSGAGHRPHLMPRTLPTPLLAFAVRHLEAAAGVMVTASHNPARDNGYKVYLADGGGSQIAPPNDALIAAHIDAVGALDTVPRGGLGETIGEAVIDAYVDRAVSLIAPETGLDVRVVHTSMHGVGHETFRRVLTTAGFPEPVSVPEQRDPDPRFPTVAFPNPEEPGALDLAMALAEAQSPPADAIIANDPDADRVAVAVHDPELGRWRRLSGDDMGLLLGWHLASHGRPGTLATTIVSSEALEALAHEFGRPYARTLTGFKWISKVPGLAFGYEEAIGYCCDPAAVNDKDGVTGGLVVVELISRLKAHGKTLLDGLRDIDRITGNRVTTQLSIRSDDPARIQALMADLRRTPPARLGEVAVAGVEDLSVEGRALPPEQGLRLLLGNVAAEHGPRGWIAVRPSGTEPKMKCYLELGDPGAADREPVVAALEEVKGALDEWFRQLG